MIKINLLSNYSSADSEVLLEIELQNRIKSEFLKRVIVFALGPLALYAYEMYNIPLLEDSRNQVQVQLSQLTEFNLKKDAIAKEIEKYEEDKKRLNTQTIFLERISKERLYPVEFLTKLKAFIPSGVWLETIVSQGKEIEMRGEGESEIAINQFESSLKNIEAIKNVRLVDSSLKPNPAKEGLNIRSFYIKTEYAIEVTNE